MLVAALLGLVAEALFLFRVAMPHILVFDEVHYVPAARTLLALATPVNTEHPLLGKAIIAAGIALFGDNSLGWRFFSTVAGAVTVVALFAITWQVLGRMRPAVLAALFAMLNITLFVQARIAMLDGFMAAFVVSGIVVLLASMRAAGGRAFAGVTLGGALIGLAIGCKWAAVPFLGYAGVAILILRRRGVGGRVHWAGVGTLPLLLALTLGAAVAYLLTFLPAFFYARDPLTLAALLPFQLTIYAEQTHVLPPHPYQSAWWSWPLMLRPIWYFYEPADGAMRGILMIGNPVILWGGLVALAACLWAGVRDRSAPLLTIAALWVGAYLPWIVIPKSLGFFYYYFLPSLFLCPALAAALDLHASKGRQAGFVILAGALFVYFYPIIAAMPLAGPDAFQRWTWFARWI